MYLEVANGGFGPRGDALGVAGHDWHGGDWEDILDAHAAFASDPDERTPPGLVPLLDWGCAIWSLIDLRDPAGPMWCWDPNLCCLDHALFPQGKNLADWLTELVPGPFPDTSLERPDT